MANYAKGSYQAASVTIPYHITGTFVDVTSEAGNFGTSTASELMAVVAVSAADRAVRFRSPGPKYKHHSGNWEIGSHAPPACFDVLTASCNRADSIAPSAENGRLHGCFLPLNASACMSFSLRY